MRSLEGLRVLDISRALAGPYCTMIFGDLGADVIKVELPELGDESRSWGPPFVGEPNASYPGESAYFLSINRNKRSITINLKSIEGQDIIKRLAGLSDVFVENFRTGTLEKIGLGYADLSKINPRLIYCSISGYGRTGPFAELPGYDFIIQAEGGFMGVTGPENGPPYRVGISIIDISTGILSATAILAALHARQSSGEGQFVDISLMDSSVALLANVASNYLVGGIQPRRMGNAHSTIAPYEAFQASDRWFALGAANSRQWELLCDVIGAPELKVDPRFASNKERVKNRSTLFDTLNTFFSKFEAQEWITRLQEAGIPCGQINTIEDVFTHPQADDRGFIVEIEHPTVGVVRSTGFPYKFSKSPADAFRPPPLLGEHNEEILVEVLGFSKEQVDRFREEKII